MLAAVLMLALVVQAGEAAAVTAECRAPEAPPVIRPVKPTRPATPSCVDEARARHNCRPAAYAAFERELAAYGEALQRKALWAQGLSEGLTPAWLAVATELQGLMTRRMGAKTR